MFEVEYEGSRYESRGFPFSEEDVRRWAAELPAEDTHGLLCTVRDASFYNGGLRTLGQYIKSDGRRLGKPGRSGTIRIFTLKVRHLKRGPVFTSYRDFRSWDEHEMALLEEHCRNTLRHEVGHWVIANLKLGVPLPREEHLCDLYAAHPERFHETHGYLS